MRRKSHRAPAHYNPPPMFGLRVQEPNVAIYRAGALVGYAFLDLRQLRAMGLSP